MSIEVSSTQSIVFGYSDTQYYLLRSKLSLEPDSDSYLYSFENTSSFYPESDRMPLDNDAAFLPIKSQCKNSLINLVCLNVFRNRSNTPIVPLYFCYSYSHYKGSRWEPNLRQIASTYDKDRTSDAEIRLMDKLVNKFPHEEVRDIAKATFHFVHCHKARGGMERYEPISILPPWEDSQWEALRHQRKPSRVALVDREVLPAWVTLVLDKINEGQGSASGASDHA